MPKKAQKPRQSLHEKMNGHKLAKNAKGRCAICLRKKEIDADFRADRRRRKRAAALPDAVQAPLFGGVCPKQFEKCRKCRGNKVTPMGSPAMNVQCGECLGEGVRLYPIHTMELVSSEVARETTTENAIKITTHRDKWQCAKCPHAETKERAERTELNGEDLHRN